MLKIRLDDSCPYCGNLAVYRSQPETWLARVCLLLPLELVRCHGCMRQHYRPLLSPAPECPSRSTEAIHPNPNYGKQTTSDGVLFDDGAEQIETRVLIPSTAAVKVSEGCECDRSNQKRPLPVLGVLGRKRFHECGEDSWLLSGSGFR